MANNSKTRFRQVCLSVFALLAMTGAVAAQNEVCWRKPPSRYLHEPVRPYTVNRVDTEMLGVKCNGDTSAFAAVPWACANTETNEIWIRTELPHPEGQWLSCILQHEKAHLNGWSYFHPIR